MSKAPPVEDPDEIAPFLESYRGRIRALNLQRGTGVIRSPQGDLPFSFATARLIGLQRSGLRSGVWVRFDVTLTDVGPRITHIWPD